MKHLNAILDVLRLELKKEIIFLFEEIQIEFKYISYQ